MKERLGVLAVNSGSGMSRICQMVNSGMREWGEREAVKETTDCHVKSITWDEKLWDSSGGSKTQQIE